MSLTSTRVTAKCSLCSSLLLSTFYKVSRVPTHIGILWKRKDEALGCPRGDIELAYCNNCGFISNTAFDPSMITYTKEYDNSLHFSKRYHDYAKSIAQRLIKEYQLYNKKIIEIGSGKGDFLSLLCEIGDNYGIGFDPSYHGDSYCVGSGNRITIIEDYYSETYSYYHGDLICSRNVFEHIPNPLEFLKMLRIIINGKNNTILYFEVPNVLLILKDLSVWDIIYEHCSYYGITSLEKGFNLSKFNTIKLSQGFGDQFISIEATPAKSIGKSLVNNSDDLRELDALVKEFSYKCKIKLKMWQDRLKQIEQNNEKTVVWGAGGKTISFLNILNVKDQINYVVDINPRKQGCYIPGTGQKIILPEELKEYMPDTIIIMNSIYQQEIQNYINSLGLSPLLLFDL
jgi:hypothetical protein